VKIAATIGRNSLAVAIVAAALVVVVWLQYDMKITDPVTGGSSRVWRINRLTGEVCEMHRSTGGRLAVTCSDTDGGMTRWPSK
jgi:hypothetical protein